MKTFKTILAVAVAAMAFVGCAKEQNVELNEKVTMTYSVSLDSASGTRADFDGSNANELAYAAYLKVSEGVYSDAPVATGTAAVSNGSATVNIELLKGQQYLVTFFAYNNADANKWWTLNNNILTFDHSKVTLNSDVNDVFVGKTESQSVTLTRPLALMNLAIKKTHLENAESLGMAKANTTFTAQFNEIATKYDLKAGGVLDATENISFTVAGNDLVEDGDYLTIGKLLILGGEQNVKLDLEVKCSSLPNQTVYSGQISDNVPAKANYKTNIKLNSLLTATPQYSVTINAGFGGTEDKVIP